ncbi:Zinc finger- C2H2-type/integrase- DNA-binding protein [Apiospora sp. TS-2023a]
MQQSIQQKYQALVNIQHNNIDATTASTSPYPHRLDAQVHFHGINDEQSQQTPTSSNPPYPYLKGSAWGTTTAEGTQNFHGDAEDFPFSFGHTTPRANGQDHIDVIDDITGKWLPAEEAPAVVSEPMRRISSQSSADSHSQKHRTLKAASQQKHRPNTLSDA